MHTLAILLLLLVVYATPSIVRGAPSVLRSAAGGTGQAVMTPSMLCVMTG
jgi:hypothetical protein